jgi:hypothetical protein
VSLRRDHIAGAATVGVALVAIAISGDLPVGTLASPGPGMLPILAAALILLFGSLLLLRAHTGPPFAAISWTDLPHALRVVAVAATALLLYERLGFLLTIGGLLLVLLWGVERRPLWSSVAFAAGTALGAYVLVGKFLKSPLPSGILGF